MSFYVDSTVRLSLYSHVKSDNLYQLVTIQNLAYNMTIFVPYTHKVGKLVLVNPLAAHNQRIFDYATF